MLKIKDNIDLKELEKFGFEHYPLIYIKESKRYDDDINMNIAKRVYVDEKTRKISLGTILFNTEIELDTLYDLIKADLVEKVEDIR